SPLTMTIPLIILAVFAVIAGFMGLPAVFSSNHIFANYLAPIFQDSKNILAAHPHLDHSTEWMLMGIATLAAILSIGIAYNFYINSKLLPESDSETKGFSKWVANKFYVDELYEKVFVKPMMVISDLFYVLVDKLIVDLLVMASAWIVGFTGRAIRLVQTGNTGFYLFMMVIGMMVFMFIQLVY
ncbi:MAG: NADH-quinone oxidoreductase subunit L, partial [Bacteroidia bacterium]|nr:NADH-quinone oxidoreductase subunit L [Bacteroidia bacterium]